MAIRRLVPPAKRETGGALSHRDGLTFGECAGSDGATHASSGVNGGPFAQPPFPPFICVVRASRRARVSARPSSTWESCSSNIARYRSSSLVASSHRPSMFRSRRDMVMRLPFSGKVGGAHAARVKDRALIGDARSNENKEVSHRDHARSSFDENTKRREKGKTGPALESRPCKLASRAGSALGSRSDAR